MKLQWHLIFHLKVYIWSVRSHHSANTTPLQQWCETGSRQRKRPQLHSHFQVKQMQRKSCDDADGSVLERNHSPPQHCIPFIPTVLGLK